MTARALLLTGLGLLLPSLLLALDVSAVGAWLSSVLSLIGCGLVVVSALVSALRRSEVAPEPGVDHYA